MSSAGDLGIGMYLSQGAVQCGLRRGCSGWSDRPSGVASLMFPLAECSRQWRGSMETEHSKRW